MKDSIIIHRTVLILLILSFIPFNAVASGSSLQLVSTAAQPLFTDDASLDSLLCSARQHRSYLERLPADHSTTIGTVAYPRHWLLSSLDEFTSLLKHSHDMKQLSKELFEKFDIYHSAGRSTASENNVLVTGYYEPVVKGSLTPSAIYQYPLYSLPPSLVTRKDRITGQKAVGRIGPNGNFRPFWTRAEIDNLQVLAGSELVYLRDPLDAFFLQIQGSGKIEFPDGTLRSLGFDGHNGHSYKSIGKLLVNEGKITLEESSTPTIKDYLLSHPEEQRRILHHNPRVIFFAWKGSGPPKGSLGVPLTPGRSIAIDQSLLPTGVFYWLSTSRPIVDTNGRAAAWIPDSRFVFPQDSGAAIKGPGRVDLFMGAGHYAQSAAGLMRQPGKLFVFIKKGYVPN